MQLNLNEISQNYTYGHGPDNVMHYKQTTERLPPLSQA